MLKKIILAGMLLVLCGCPGDSDARKEENPAAPIATNVPVPTKVETPEEIKSKSLQKQLDDANKKIADATAKGDIIAKLSAEKEALMLNVQISDSNAKQWEQNAKSYKSQYDDKDKELTEAKIDAWKVKLWWMAAICGILAIVAAGIAFGMPLLRPVAKNASIVLGAISGIMLFVAQSLGTIAWLLGLVPYILGVGALAAVVYGLVALRHWYKDHHSLKQTVEGVEVIKGKIEGFGEHMLKYVDNTMVRHVKDYKKKIKNAAALEALKPK